MLQRTSLPLPVSRDWIPFKVESVAAVCATSRYSTALVSPPTATLTFNGSPAPSCPLEPDCSTGEVPTVPVPVDVESNKIDITNATTTTTTTSTTTTTTEDLGCNSNATLCPGHELLCQIPDYNNCVYCAGFDCEKGDIERTQDN